MARCYRSMRLFATAGPLAKSEDNELGRLHWCHTNLDDQLALVADLLRIELFITLNIEGFFRRATKQLPITPAHCQECASVTPHLGPQVMVVRLEDHPLRAALDRLLNEIEQTPYAHIAPGRVAAERSRTPDPQAAPGEGANTVDADRIQHILLALGDRHSRIEHAA